MTKNQKKSVKWRLGVLKRETVLQPLPRLGKRMMTQKSEKKMETLKQHRNTKDHNRMLWAIIQHTQKPKLNRFLCP
jgi:hypothetical protein